MVLVGTAAVVANLGYGLWWLSFLLWIPWLHAIEGTTPRRALWLGWIAGVVAVFFGFFWIDELLRRFAGFPLPLSLATVFLFAAYQGLQFAIPAVLLRWLQPASGWALLLLAPACWVAVEAVLPNIFPLYIAILWASQPAWIQAAELGGVTTVSFLMVTLGTSLYQVLRSAAERRLDVTAALVAIALGIGIPTLGRLRMAAIDARVAEAPSIEVGVVQGNMSIEEMLTRAGPPRILDKHQRMTAELQGQGAELVLWGETAYPRGFHRDETVDYPLSSPWRVRRGFDVPLVFGLVTYDPEESPYPWNTATLLDTDDALRDRYDKVYPLVFGEYVPLVDPEWFLDLIPTASHLNRGDGPTVLRWRDWRFAPLICYEDILPRYVREAAQLDAHAFLNLTNDAWFGKTSEPAQHLALAVFRTVEQRRAMVRAVNTGISAYIDPAGRIVKRTRITDPKADGPTPAEGFVVSLPLLDPERARTPYARTGELWNATVLFGVGVAAAVAFRRRRRKKAESRQMGRLGGA